jgi:GNAT superfamily N-acetyltransferase
MIRPATPADVPVIAGLIRALAEYEKLADHVSFDETKIAEHLFGQRAYAECLLAEPDGEAVGFALFFHNYSTFLGKPGIYLEDLFVVPEHRGRGLGKALLAGIGKLAVERECGRIEWSVLDWNTPAIGFYEKLGAKPVGGWTVYRLTGDSIAELARG